MHVMEKVAWQRETKQVSHYHTHKPRGYWTGAVATWLSGIFLWTGAVLLPAICPGLRDCSASLKDNKHRMQFQSHPTQVSTDYQTSSFPLSQQHHQQLRVSRVTGCGTSFPVTIFLSPTDRISNRVSSHNNGPPSSRPRASFKSLRYLPQKQGHLTTKGI